MYGDLAGMSQTLGGVQKVCANKVRAHSSFPKLNYDSNFLAPLMLSTKQRGEGKPHE